MPIIDTHLLICGVIKDVEKQLPQNMELLKEIGNHFTKYKILLYENNSTDSTKSILTTMVSENVRVIMEETKPTKENSQIWAYTAVTGSDHYCRIENICKARNVLVEEINKPEFDSYNVVVWIDLDCNAFSVEGIVHAVNQVRNTKKVFFGNSSEYYDYYALRMSSNHHLLGPEIIGEPFWDAINMEKINLDHDQPVQVYSAYNGVGVYPKECFQKARFHCIVNDNVKRVYRKILRENPETPYSQYIRNECNKFYGGMHDEDVFWKNNSGYDKPVICEHIGLNFQLIENGYELFIDPRMMFDR
jgi:hypothetical protein